MSSFEIEEQVIVVAVHAELGPAGRILCVVPAGRIGLVKDPDGGNKDALIDFGDTNGEWVPWKCLSPYTILDQMAEI
jgi:hypothetical protein